MKPVIGRQPSQKQQPGPESFTIRRETHVM